MVQQAVMRGTAPRSRRAYVETIMRKVFVLLCAAAAMSLSAAPRAIPGITAKDAFPAACVGCHVKRPDGDMRISALLAKLKKKHPTVPMKDIPAACAKCHGKTTKIALAPMLHRIHLGNDKGLFLTKFDGECTHCHKLDRKTGVWSVPGGPEK